MSLYDLIGAQTHIYRTRDEHANYYTTDTVISSWELEL